MVDLGFQVLRSLASLAGHVTLTNGYGLQTTTRLFRSGIVSAAESMLEGGCKQELVAKLLGISRQALNNARFSTKTVPDQYSLILRVSQVIQRAGDKGILGRDIAGKLGEDFDDFEGLHLALEAALATKAVEKRDSRYFSLSNSISWTTFSSEEGVYSRFCDIVEIVLARLTLPTPENAQPDVLFLRQRDSIAEELIPQALEELEEVVGAWGLQWEEKSRQHVEQFGGTIVDLTSIISSANLEKSRNSKKEELL
jgi:transcriptional regulator with XRE-family HTH domain